MSYRSACKNHEFYYRACENALPLTLLSLKSCLKGNGSRLDLALTTCFTISPICIHIFSTIECFPFRLEKCANVTDYYRENGNVSNVLDYCGRNNIGDKRADKQIISLPPDDFSSTSMYVYILWLWFWPSENERSSRFFQFISKNSSRTTRRRVLLIFTALQITYISVNI